MVTVVKNTFDSSIGEGVVQVECSLVASEARVEC